MKMLCPALVILLLLVNFAGAQTTVKKKQGDPVIIEWEYDNAVGQTGFKLKSATTASGPFAAVASGTPILAAARSLTFPAAFPSGTRFMYYVLTAVNDNPAEESEPSAPPVTVEKLLGSPGNVKVK